MRVVSQDLVGRSTVEHRKARNMTRDLVELIAEPPVRPLATETVKAVSKCLNYRLRFCLSCHLGKRSGQAFSLWISYI
jgi:hypothetical protein